jgi:hypothetical protein
MAVIESQADCVSANRLYRCDGDFLLAHQQDLLTWPVPTDFSRR